MGITDSPASLYFYNSEIIVNICLCRQAEIETHAQPGSLSVYVHYGQSRSRDAKVLAQNDVVITTYGVLSSEFSPEVALKCKIVCYLWMLLCIIYHCLSKSYSLSSGLE